MVDRDFEGSVTVLVLDSVTAVPPEWYDSLFQCAAEEEKVPCDPTGFRPFRFWELRWSGWKTGP